MITISPEDLANRAFQLAYFLHCERKTATEIATRALNKLELAAMAQGKRLYYRLTGRAAARKARSKVSMGQPHLLQRLVYVESEEFERRREAAAGNSHPADGLPAASHSDLVVFFVKHLVRITTRRNSFYVTLGLSRLLYNYTTPETMELYNLVIQDPDRVHDDYYYRSRKGLLLKEIKERFGELLEISKGARGEQRWRASDSSSEDAPLVRECLLWFTPWATPCVVPERFDPFTEQIEQLDFQGRHPDEEHEVEVNRIHATLHPDCFARLAAANRLPAPDDRLELPDFLVARDSDDGNRGSRVPPKLSEDEMRLINDLLAQEAGRRKAAASGFFRVMVDGVEAAQIDPARSATVRFMVQADAELIEVYGSDGAGPLLMATHLLDLNHRARRNFNITVEGGQNISFAVAAAGDGEEAATEVTVTVTETAATKRALSSARRLGAFLGFSGAGAASWWKPAAAFAVLALLIAGGWLAWRKQTPQQQVVTAQPTPPASSPAPEQRVNKPAEETAQHQQTQNGLKPTPAASPLNVTPERDETLVARTILPANETGDPSEAETRGGLNSTLKGKALAQVRRVYLQVAASGAERTFSDELQTVFKQGSGLQLSGADTADAALKISVRQTGQNDPRVIVTVMAVSADGHLIWPATRRNSKVQYVGRPRYIAERLMSDLTRDIEKARR